VRKLSELPTLPVTPRAFGTLSEADRRTLRRWIMEAKTAGIDDVQDLAPRRWPTLITGAVLGVFIPGDDHAAWLAVEQNGLWAVASCIDGSVSQPVESLEDALAIVYRAGEAMTCS
jgi:hypothetical protein